MRSFGHEPWFSRCAEQQCKATPEVRPGQVGPGLGVQAMLVDHLGPGLSCYSPWLMNYLRRLLVTLGVCGSKWLVPWEDGEGL